MFGALRRLKQIAARKRFKAMVARFDEQIAEAQAKHQPVNHIKRAKSAFVHQCLERRA